MAHFYGSVQGHRGEATRLGSKSNGLRASAQSYSGSVIVQMFVGDDGEDWCCINAREGSTAYPGGNTVFRGPIKQLLVGAFYKSALPALSP